MSGPRGWYSKEATRKARMIMVEKAETGPDDFRLVYSTPVVDTGRVIANISRLVQQYVDAANEYSAKSHRYKAMRDSYQRPSSITSADIGICKYIAYCHPTGIKNGEVLYQPPTKEDYAVEAALSGSAAELELAQTHRQQMHTRLIASISVMDKIIGDLWRSASGGTLQDGFLSELSRLCYGTCATGEENENEAASD